MFILVWLVLAIMIIVMMNCSLRIAELNHLAMSTSTYLSFDP